MKLRLQKYLSECGVASRRGAEDLIREGRVFVNGEIAELGSKVDPEVDRVEFEGKLVKSRELGVILFHKPLEVVSTLSDPQGRVCLADYVRDRFTGYSPAGRLDYMTSGLLIFSNDGDLVNWLLHPRYEHERVYRALVQGIPNAALLTRIAKGVELSDGEARAEVKIIAEHGQDAELEVIVREGRNRLVRRLFDAVQHKVLQLHRISHGELKLGDLKEGKFKRLPEKVYARLRSQMPESQIPASQG